MILTKIEKMQSIIQHSEHIVFFGGAGVSTESGIPDFRGTGGLYTEDISDVSVEMILSKPYFESNPKDFFRFFRERMMFGEVQPNTAHLKLAELEQHGKRIDIVTQNIDGLHQKAGSRNVIELHGGNRTSHCVRCHREYLTERVIQQEIPVCECGGIIKPDMVLYGEAILEETLQKAQTALKSADTLIIAGTSLTVYPAKNMPKNHFKGKHLIIMNQTPTFMDNWTSMVFREKIGELFSEIKSECEELPTVPDTFHVPYKKPYEF